MSEWVPDVLGDGFEQFTLALEDDEQGPVLATLVRSLPPERSLWDRMLRRHPMLGDVDVLYVHGWSDYFFNKRLARFFTSRGARFFALDLRKYGRSLREGQSPGYVSDLAAYDEEIAAALGLMGHRLERGRSERRLLLLGHSTGGLVLSLWAHRHPGVASGVLLNSPWLELQLAGFAREAIIAPILGLQAKWHPLEPTPQLDAGHYTRSIAESADPDDPNDINPAWRPEKSMPVTAGWLKAIVDGHAQVAAGLAIDAPVGVVLSARSASPLRWSDELLSADSVLVVDDIARAALKIAPSVTIERIDGALHDVFLSRREVRTEVYARLERWVTGWAAATRQG